MKKSKTQLHVFLIAESTQRLKSTLYWFVKWESLNLLGQWFQEIFWSKSLFLYVSCQIECRFISQTSTHKNILIQLSRTHSFNCQNSIMTGFCSFRTCRKWDRVVAICVTVIPSAMIGLFPHMGCAPKFLWNSLLVLGVITKNRVIITNHGEYWPLFFFFNFHCLKVRKKINSYWKSKTSVSYQKKNGHAWPCPSFFWYDKHSGH